MISRISRATDSVFARLAVTKEGLPETDKEWDDFFRANDWRGNEYEDDETPTAGNYGASPATRLQRPDYGSSFEDAPARAALFPRPSRDLSQREQTVCHDCAAYMANGEGDPEHEHRFENGMRELANEGAHWQNLTLNGQDEEGNRIPPQDNKCMICGQRVDPELDNFLGERGEGTIGERAHLFQPGDPGYHEPGR